MLYSADEDADEPGLLESLAGLSLADGTLDVALLEDDSRSSAGAADSTLLAEASGSSAAVVAASDASDDLVRAGEPASGSLSGGGRPRASPRCPPQVAAGRRLPPALRQDGAGVAPERAARPAVAVRRLSAASDDLSRWSDFVTSDDEFFTADEGGAPPYARPPEPRPPVCFSPALEACLAAAPAAPPHLARLEEELSAALGDAAAAGGRAARRTCFNYLLLDPRVTARRGADGRLPLAAFVAAIFYVGKGQQSRPYSHLVEAVGSGAGAKLEHIRAIWRSGAGVVVLSVFHHRLSAEAFTREAAMIDAIGVRNLTNGRRGEYYGPAKAWTRADRSALGAGLLYNAWRVYLVEGETQLRPEDLGR